MSEIKALEKLRELSEIRMDGWLRMDTRKIADEIEAEIGREWMRLPVDADGVPISMGDAVSHGSDRFIAFALHDGYVFRECGFKNGHYIVKAYEADELRHVKPRTIEDVLRDLVNYFNPNAEWTQLDKSAVAEYADELRELMGGDAS